MLLRIAYFAFGLTVLISGLPGLATAAQNAFTENTYARLTDAVARNDFPTFNSLITAAIARTPSQANQIALEAIRIAPIFEDRILQSTRQTFPGFSWQALPRETARHGLPPAQNVDVAAELVGDVSISTVPGIDTDDTGWSGEVGIGGSRSTGNTDREQANAAVKIIRRYPSWNHEVNLKLDFARKDKETSARRLVTNLDVRYDPSNGYYAFAFFQYEDDRFSGFDYELTESAGLGRRLIDTEKVYWALEIGPGARQSEVSDTGKSETDIVGRGKSEFAWNISNSAEFSNSTEVKTGKDRTTTENITELSTKIIGSLLAKISFEIRHNSDAPKDTKSTDTLTKISLAYRF